MLADLPRQRLAVVLGHPILGFDEVAGVDALVKALLQRHLIGGPEGLGRGIGGALGVQRLGVHVEFFPDENRAQRGRWSTTRRALPVSVRSMLSGRNTSMRVFTPTKVLMRCCSQ